MSLPTVLIVEDEQITALDLEETLTRLGYHVVGVADTGARALDLAATYAPGLVLMDIRLRGSLDGVITAERLQALRPVPVVYLTAHADHATVQRAVLGNPFGYLIKPFDEHELRTALALAVAKHALERRLRAEEQRLRTTLQGLTEGVLVTDVAGELTFLNRAALALLHVTSEDALHRPLHEVLVLVDRTTRHPIDHVAAQVLRTGEPLRLPGQPLLLTCDGRSVPVEVESAALRDESGAPSGVVTVVRDISGRLVAEEAVQRANRRLQESIAALERRNAELQVLHTLASDLQLAVTSAGACVAIVEAVRQFFPRDSGMLLLRRADDGALEPVFSWGGRMETGSPFPVAECSALRDRQIFVSGEGAACALCPHAPIKSFGGISCVPLATPEQPIGVLLLGHGPPAHATSPQSDSATLADRRRLAAALADQAALGLANVLLREALREQAIRDPLTGLFNRRYMEETLLRELARAERYQYPIGLIILDIDHFKAINDEHGHTAGDKVLRAVGALLQAHVRASDIACRYGGEEFLLVLPSANGEAALSRAHVIREALRQMRVEHAGRLLPGITISAGVTAMPERGDDVGAAVSRADRALYAAKAAGRNRAVLAGPVPYADRQGG